MKRYYYTVTTLLDAEPTYHRFYCSKECTQKKARKHFENKGYYVDTISGIWEE
jgi:hypothetical protein